MPQAISGVFATLDDLPEQIDRARRARRLSWAQLAEGSGWTRQYLQAEIARPVVRLEVLEFLARSLNIRLQANVAPSVSFLIHHQPSPDPT